MTYVIFVIFSNMKVLLAKKITELKFMSYIMFLGIFLMLIVFIVKSFQPKSEIISLIEEPIASHKFEDYVDCINIIILCYGMMHNVFPIVSKMSDSRTPNVILSVFVCMVITVSFYILLTLLVINLYGQKININLLTHLENDRGMLSTAVKLVFLMILFFKVPYIFFPGKLSCFYIL